ncbi:MAG: hypothetical protein JXQ71_03970 [Verrucomicrobia bacterium]|nr:hypothetical protein [Verrucomicrobiota bacterium]
MYDITRKVNGGRWIEAAWRTEDGTLHGWYHLGQYELAGRTARFFMGRHSDRELVFTCPQ